MKTLSQGAFEVSHGTVCGGAHRRLGRPAQDGVAVVSTENCLVAVVTDGCGGSISSEVGARLGAPLWAEALARERDGGGTSGLDLGILERARQRVTATLETLLAAMPGPRAAIVRDYFLYTVLGAVIDSQRTLIFGIGDGVVGINGAFMALEPGDGNAPAYHAYDLTAQTKGLGEVSFLAIRPSVEVQSVVLATDGVTPLLSSGGRGLGELVSCERNFSNRDQLRRRLERLAITKIDVDWDRERVTRQSAILEDDTTIVSIRRAG